MPDLLDTSHQEFQQDVSRIRQLLQLVQTLREFGATDPPAQTPDEPWVVAAASLRDLIRSLGADLPALSGTLLLFLAGRFEHFVRMSFQALCDSLAQKCDRFEQLPDRMRQSLRHFTAEVALTPSKYGFDEVEALGFIVALAENVSADGGIGTVNSACLSVTQSNLNPGTLADLYKRIGVQNLWQDVSKQAKLKAHLELDKDADSEREARARLEDLMTTRNQIAHPSGSPAFPGPEKVVAYLDFVTVLADTLVDISRVQIAAFKPGSENGGSAMA
jgi:hypothetical protein